MLVAAKVKTMHINMSCMCLDFATMTCLNKSKCNSTSGLMVVALCNDKFDVPRAFCNDKFYVLMLRLCCQLLSYILIWHLRFCGDCDGWFCYVNLDRYSTIRSRCSSVSHCIWYFEVWWYDKSVTTSIVTCCAGGENRFCVQWQYYLTFNHMN